MAHVSVGQGLRNSADVYFRLRREADIHLQGVSNDARNNMSSCLRVLKPEY